VNAPRPSARLTSRVLTAGSIGAAAVLAVGLVLSFAGARDAAGVAGNLGVVVLLLTPVAGLVTTWSELRVLRPTHARLAIAVLLVLTLATLIALLARP
jgi:hypothetical protein